MKRKHIQPHAGERILVDGAVYRLLYLVSRKTVWRAANDERTIIVKYTGTGWEEVKNEAKT